MGAQPLISFIVVSICSANLNKLKVNLERTVLEPFELLVFENHQHYSLAYCYNYLIEKSKADLVVCLHEDILFKERGWDRKLITSFQEADNIGVLGIAGGTYKSRSFSPAWFNFRKNAHRINIVQPNTQGQLGPWVENLNNESLSEVVVVDGVFMCCRKSVWEQYNFDENTVRGFHFYDMDFCLGVRSHGYKNYVTHEILLEHYSSGKNNLDWYKNGMRVHKKWEHALPQFVGEMTNEEIRQVEYQTLEYAFNLQLKLRALGDAFISMCQLIWQRPLNGQNLLYLKNWMKQLVYAA
jgi:GT2 family glycosyltransferase